MPGGIGGGGGGGGGAGIAFIAPCNAACAPPTFDPPIKLLTICCACAELPALIAACASAICLFLAFICALLSAMSHLYQS